MTRTITPGDLRSLLATRSKRTPEGDIQAQVLACLRAHGIPCWRVNVVPVRGRKAQNVGMSDVHAVLPGGRCCWLEVKRKGTDATPEQLAFMAAVNRAGGLASVVRSVAELEHLLSPFLPQRAAG